MKFKENNTRFKFFLVNYKMLRIRKHVSIIEDKGELSARKILNQINLKESFSVNDYFKPKTAGVTLREYKSKIFTSPDKEHKKKFYDYWEIKDSLRYTSQSRFRKKDVVEKLKLKTNVLKPVDFKLSDPLQRKLNKFKKLKFG
jgi:transcriptional regulator